MAGPINETPQQAVARLTGELEAEQARGKNLADRLTAELKLRPHWALGYTDANVALQSKTAALQQLWDALGASNQTEAMAALTALKLRAESAASPAGQ